MALCLRGQAVSANCSVYMVVYHGRTLGMGFAALGGSCALLIWLYSPVNLDFVIQSLY